LSGDATAINVHLNVVLTDRLGQHERLINFVLQHGGAEVRRHVPLVHSNVSFSGLQVQTRNCGLSSARCVDDFHSM